tara:strand:+ start:8128 stop:9066 length:939 start_codon:yes stop_codon:yes gene_type:complete
MSKDFTGFGLYSSRDLVIKITGNVIYTIKDLDIGVVATKSLSANPNLATVIVYNLSQSTRELLSTSIYDYINNISPCRMSIELNNEVIYSGDIINVLHNPKREKGEYETVFSCGKGANAVKQTLNKKYAKGSSVTSILDDMISDLSSVSGLVEGSVQGLKDCMSNRTLLRSVTMEGKVIDNIKKLLKDCTSGDSEIDVYIDDGLNIVAKNTILQPITDITDFLLDSPKLTEQGANVIVSFDSTYKIGAGFTIASNNIQSSYANLTVNALAENQISGKGTYKITEVKHKIDNFSSDVAETEIVGILLANVKGQ